MTRTRAAAAGFVAVLGTALAALTGLVAPTAASATGTPTSVIVSSAPAPNGAAGTTYVIDLPYAGLTREYRAFVPTKLPSGPRPLLVALHSYTRDALNFETVTNLDANAGKNGAVVIYPQGLDDSWNAGTCCGTSSANNVDDVGFIAAAIHDVAAYRSIDRNRIAVVGGSNGAMMAYRFACERSDLVDIIDVMGGTYVAPSCSFSRPVSLLHVHGLQDTTLPFLGTASSPLDASGFPNVKGAVWGFAGMDGCGSFVTTPYNNSTIATLYNAQGCPAGTAVQLVTSSTMGHTWATGANAATYGVDMTSMTWGFDGALWSMRAAPAAL